MPASVIPISAKRQGTYVVLKTALPGKGSEPIGVLIMDPAADRLWLRMRSAFNACADAEDAEVLELLEEDLRNRAREMGASALLGWLEDSLSNALRLSER